MGAKGKEQRAQGKEQRAKGKEQGAECWLEINL
jgi:hypothetical protein